MNEPMMTLDGKRRRFSAAASHVAQSTAPAPALSAPVAPRLLPASG